MVAELVRTKTIADSDLPLYLPVIDRHRVFIRLAGAAFAGFSKADSWGEEYLRQSAYARDLTKIAAFGVLPSSEAALADAGRDGYAGCISATVNIDPPSSQRL